MDEFLLQYEYTTSCDSLWLALWETSNPAGTNDMFIQPVAFMVCHSWVYEYWNHRKIGENVHILSIYLSTGLAGFNIRLYF
jgi:hypothetical protein